MNIKRYRNVAFDYHDIYCIEECGENGKVRTEINMKSGTFINFDGTMSELMEMIKENEMSESKMYLQ